MRVIGRDCDEASVLTCFTVVSVATAVAKQNAAANAASAIRIRINASNDQLAGE
jgi:hypothetical protein